ncbi:MAG: 6-pyruvoyl trahydropterin synthase family protein [Gammaproteobacteria bacterium]
MHQLAIGGDFIARHYLIGGDWGKENVEHAHHYRVELLLEGEGLDRHGYLVDIVDLEAALETTMDKFRDKVLNGLKPFEGLNPSLERFAGIFHRSIRSEIELGEIRLTVRLWENERNWAAYAG